MTTMPSALLVPDRHYDYRIWTDLPDRLRRSCEVVLYDQQDPADPAVRRLAPGRRFDVVAAAGDSADLAVSIALTHQARGLVLFQPSLVPDPGVRMAPDASVAELVAAADWIRPVLAALEETDPVRRRELVVGAWRDRYGPHLRPADLALACDVIGDHAEDLLASMKTAVAAAEAGAEMPGSGAIAVSKLGEIDMPMTVVVSGRAVRLAEAAARQARDCRVLVAKAQTNLVWLEDADTAAEAITEMFTRGGYES
jgi:hypothetical protein